MRLYSCSVIVLCEYSTGSAAVGLCDSRCCIQGEYTSSAGCCLCEIAVVKLFCYVIWDRDGLA
jgi:hypothetical protein